MTQWQDQSGNGNTLGTIPGGALGPLVRTGVLRGGADLPQYGPTTAGNARIIDTTALPMFSNATGYTHYVITRAISPGANGDWAYDWPNGANNFGGIVLQEPGFSLGIAGLPAGHVGFQPDTLAAIDLGPTPVNTGLQLSPWGYYAVVQDPVKGTTVYGRSGNVLGANVAITANQCSGTLQIGVTSGGGYCDLLTPCYLFYLGVHSPGYIAGIFAYLAGNFGIN